MRLEISSLVSDPGVARRVRLVEGIGCELLPIRPNLVKYLRVMTVRLAACHKLAFQLLQDSHLLLTHGFTEFVTLAAGEVGKQS